jgi:hypothetical protein
MTQAKHPCVDMADSSKNKTTRQVPMTCGMKLFLMFPMFRGWSCVCNHFTCFSTTPQSHTDNSDGMKLGLPSHSTDVCNNSKHKA